MDSISEDDDDDYNDNFNGDIKSEECFHHSEDSCMFAGNISNDQKYIYGLQQSWLLGVS